MKNYLRYIALLCLFALGCEDVYNPDLDQVEDLVVIEALLTNDAAENYVRVRKTRNFYANESQEWVAGASVTISEDDGNTYQLEEASTGNFSISFEAVPGNSYKITVKAEGETYESGFETLPTVPTIDSLYVVSDTITTYTYDSDGQPRAHLVTGMQVMADLPVSTSLKNYRFTFPRTLEYVVPPPDGFPPPPPVYSWINFGQSGVFPIQGPAEYGNETQLKNRQLLFVSNRIGDFVTQEKVDSSAFMVGWLVDMSVFGISEKTYNFYESVNAQLEAEGKLFDPVYAQLEPNFECTSNPDVEVVGYFEVSSYLYRRFYAYVPYYSRNSFFHYVSDPVPIPGSGQIKSNTPPAFWQDSYSD